MGPYDRLTPQRDQAQNAPTRGRDCNLKTPTHRATHHPHQQALAQTIASASILCMHRPAMHAPKYARARTQVCSLTPRARVCRLTAAGCVTGGAKLPTRHTPRRAVHNRTTRQARDGPQQNNAAGNHEYHNRKKQQASTRRATMIRATMIHATGIDGRGQETNDAEHTNHAANKTQDTRHNPSRDQTHTTSKSHLRTAHATAHGGRKATQNRQPHPHRDATPTQRRHTHTRIPTTGTKRQRKDMRSTVSTPLPSRTTTARHDRGAGKRR